jgi:hypothetical protein
MPGRTYRIITLWFCLLFGLVWAWLTWQAGAMYVPPDPLIKALGVLLAGLIGKTWIEKGGPHQ